MLLRAVEIWFVLLTLAVLNGSLRETLITPLFGGFAAHLISTALLSTAVVVVAWTTILWIGPQSTTAAFKVGLIWLLLTVAFEFLAGHYLFRTPWEKLLADYNIFRGRIWVVVLLTTALAPVWALWQEKAPSTPDGSTAIILVTLGLAAGGIGAWQLTQTVRVWARMKGDRLVTCTATGYPAAVHVDALRTAIDTLIARSPNARIHDCSLWAAGGVCDQGCLTEALAPESTIDNIVARWYEKKKCVYCARPIATVQTFGHRPALLSPQGRTREWSDVSPARLLNSLHTDSAVCWDCHVAETLRRVHPDLVTDRPWPKNRDRRAG